MTKKSSVGEDCSTNMERGKNCTLQREYKLPAALCVGTKHLHLCLDVKIKR